LYAERMMTFPAIAACCVVALQPADGGGGTARAEVEAALARMSAAALAADVPGVLAGISHAEPTFVTEWRHWAEQLAKFRPEKFEMRVGEGDARFEPARAEFLLVMTWLITSGPKESWGAGGTERTVAFPTVVFTKDDPDGEGPLPAVWLYRGEKWTEIGGKGFTIRYIPGERAEAVAREVLEAFPLARDHDNKFFGVDPGPQILKLYTSMDHLKATVYINMPDPYLGGWSEPGESIKFLTSYGRDVPSWTNAYAHEYGHVCTWAMGPEAPKMPWWVAEGVAELAAEEFRPGDFRTLDARMRRKAATGTLVPWGEMADYVTAQQAVKMMAYWQGHHMLAFVTREWGPEKRNAWVRRMCEGGTLQDATDQVLGVAFEELDTKWRESLAPVAEGSKEFAPLR
jgi:hypothetical protein